MLFGHWGFGADDQKGITILFHGQSGTGKSLAAEALGYEVGKTLKVHSYKAIILINGMLLCQTSYPIHSANILL